MPNVFIELRDTGSLNCFLAEANGSPVVIFKHSNSCGVSGRAFAEMTKLDRAVGIVTVQKARAVSDEIEKRTGIGHETPQVLIIARGKVVWTGSHGQVRAAVVEAAVREIGDSKE